MKQDLSVAAVNFEAHLGDVEGNLDRVESWASRLAPQGVSLICFPELCLSGYDHSPALEGLCQSVPGEATQRLAAIAKAHETILIVGLPERGADGKRYITQVVVSPFGLAGAYRKTHLGPNEATFFAHGNALGIVDVGPARLGLQLCYDTHFPEVSTAQALLGADVFCAGFASPRDGPEDKRERFLRYLGARAYDNSCYLVACSLVGKTHKGSEMSGVALILDPKGQVVAETADWHEGHVQATLRASELRQLRETHMGYFLRHRRPELYLGLTQ